MDIRQRIQDALRQAKTGVTAEDVETLAVEQSVARLSADAWRDLQEACTAMEEALKALYKHGQGLLDTGGEWRRLMQGP